MTDAAVLEEMLAEERTRREAEDGFLSLIRTGLLLPENDPGRRFAELVGTNSAERMAELARVFVLMAALDGGRS